MTKFLAILNTITLAVTIYISYYAQAFGMNNNTISSLSKEYNNLFTPADYAFAIWGLIYIGLIGFVIFQLKRAFSKHKYNAFIKYINFNFAIANIANMLWISTWLYEFTFASVIFMLIILYCLLRIIVKTDMERWDAPLEIIFFVWWPICLYSGLIAVATIANIAAYLVKIGWHGWYFTEVQWTIIMIVIAFLINLAMVVLRNMREFAMVGAWAFIAIYIRHQQLQPAIAQIALIAAIVLGVVSLAHGYINRKTSPFIKLKQRFSKG
ncbi:tryptophan-rich sensory protein [Zhouia sp. PK063]|uniref:tryptophan-rich sensory protein n=1 Tax=Zhouia sp. PK063 TaxID=3373602 RepID=UPI0037B4FC05